jgi:hypothetical protein
VSNALNLRDVPVSDCRHPISPLIVFFGPKPSSLFGGFRQSFVIVSDYAQHSCSIRWPSL